MRVLLLENDPVTEMYVTEELRREDIEVVATASGVEALQHLRVDGWDAFVCDLVMPGVTGFDVLQRAAEFLPGKVIAATALDKVELTDLPPGVKVLQKPYTAKQLMRCLRSE